MGTVVSNYNTVNTNTETIVHIEAKLHMSHILVNKRYIQGLSLYLNYLSIIIKFCN